MMKLAGLAFYIGLIGWGHFGLAGTPSPARTALSAKSYQKAIDLVEKISVKTAEDYYLLGQAYYLLGQNEKAVKAWTETLLINKDLAKRDKWTFLFPPGKKLKAKQKAKFKDDFESQFKQLSSSLARRAEQQADLARHKSEYLQIEADRSQAMAESKSEAIKSKVRLAERGDQRPLRRETVSSTSTPTAIPIWIWMVVGTFVFGFLVYVLFFKPKAAPGASNRRPQAKRYRVAEDDEIFGSGPFWFEGQYYHDSDMFYNRYGYYYTNRMYIEHYDRYGQGQGRDGSLDAEIQRDVDDREQWRDTAADQRAEAAVAAQKAREFDDEARSYRQAAQTFDDQAEFEDDDDSSEQDGHDDNGGFEDDAGSDDDAA